MTEHVEGARVEARDKYLKTHKYGRQGDVIEIEIRQNTGEM